MKANSDDEGEKMFFFENLATIFLLLIAPIFFLSPYIRFSLTKVSKE
jgi:hypothetical protein